MIISRWQKRVLRAWTIRRLRRRSNGILRELLSVSPSERHSLLGRPDVKNALVSLGTDEGVRWLEIVLETPVMVGWGNLLYELNPSWSQLDRWVHLSKEHCLAAMDALERFAPNTQYGDNSPSRLPEGADPEKINRLIDDALTQYNNHRLRLVEKQIRHAWPLGEPKRHPVCIPEPIARAARVLFGNKSSLIREWTASMETALDPPITADDIWNWLLEFGDHECVLARFDWKVDGTDVVARMKETPAAKGAPINWLRLKAFKGEVQDLCNLLATEMRDSGRTLVELDTGGDDWALAIIPSQEIPNFVSVAIDCLNKPSVIRVI